MSFKASTIYKLTIIIGLVSLATACGGGGGSEPVTVTPPTTTNPVNTPVSGTVTIVGTSSLGSILTISQNLNDANGLGSFSYQWLRNNENIDGATNDTYTIVSADSSAQISVTISFIDGDGFSETASSSPFMVDDFTAVESQVNILVIITDDQGLDASNQYAYSDDTPVTPTLDSLASQGIVFDNTFVTPACTTTRASILTGMHGVNSGVTRVPDEMDATLETLPKYIKSTANNYATAAIGKWHLAGGANTNRTHPNESGFDYYAGNLSNVDDYFNWTLTTNGEQSTVEEYHTTAVTNLAIDWIQQQSSPWFMWLAYSAPHSPFHLPPDDLHNRSSLSGTETDINENTREYYLAAIEAIDAEVGRLIATMDEQTLENTVIFVIGDNGTPARVVDSSVFLRDHSKGSLYEGGIRVPMIVSGGVVDRMGEREKRLINGTDFYTTIGQLAGKSIEQMNDSISFVDMLRSETSDDFLSYRVHNYSEFESDNVTGWTVSDGFIKLIQLEDGSQELYRVDSDLSEVENLIDEVDFSTDIQRLTNIGNSIRGVSDNPTINLTNQNLVNRNTNCKSYTESYFSDVMDVNNSRAFDGQLSIEVNGDKCIFNTNAIPNHDFNDGGDSFPNDVTAQDDTFQISASPRFANETSTLSLRVDNALLLNGVKVDLLAAACFGVGDEKTGCNDDSTPWRFDPMHPPNNFRVDSHNAHAQPDGTYHYHGTPNALYVDGNNDQASPVLGFAADGFPIYGPYIDDNGVIRKALPSYQLRSGDRPDGNGNPGGAYDGTYRDDYEFVSGSGDLDECNGMMVDGSYGYYITDDYPYILACFKGTPDTSFNK